MSGNPKNWLCPHCGRHTTITDDRRNHDQHAFHLDNKLGKLAFTTDVISCPNAECREITVHAALYKTKPSPGRTDALVKPPVKRWTLIPEAQVRPFPAYVPKPILDDYREACLIRELSPKASATLSRRCLQGMIRDFWAIKKPTLALEIAELQNEVDAVAWAAIDGLRTLGNIGAHMEKDINAIVDVDPDEAGQLIGLIETLIEDWYVQRHDREERMKKISVAAKAKKPPKP